MLLALAVALVAGIARAAAAGHGTGGSEEAVEMPETGRLLFALFLLFVSAKIAGELCLRIRQPAVVGEIIVGMGLGFYLRGHGAEWPFLETFAELCVVFLLFIVGLEIDPAGLLRVGVLAGSVAAAGMVLPFAFGFGLYYLLGLPNPDLAECLFVGAALTATSVGITARVMSDLGQLGTRVARVILGAAVGDDIGGMLVLAVVVAITAGAVSSSQLILLLGQAVGVLAAAYLVGRWVVKRARPRLYSFTIASNARVAFGMAIAVCFAFGALAERVELAAIIGAFFAGIIFAELPEAPELRRSMEPIYELLIPIFFVTMGAKVDVPLLLGWGVLKVGLILTVLAIIGKIVGCSLAAYRMGWREAFTVGVGMAPRGEIGIVVALIGLKASAIGNEVYSQVLLMSVITSLFAPSLLRVMLTPRVEVEPAQSDPDKTPSPQ